MLHLLASFLISAVLGFGFAKNPEIPISFTIGIGIGKEVGDYMNYGSEVGNLTFAKMASEDLLMDSIGILAGTYTGLKLREFWRNKGYESI